jgi:CubicO group peptidase (beta-lactamase class C family)
VFLAGVTKLYTAALVLRLAERGRLTLDDPNSTVRPAPSFAICTGSTAPTTPPR